MGFFDSLFNFKNQKIFDQTTKKATPLDIQQLKDTGFGTFKPLRLSGKVPDLFGNPIRFFGSFDINRVIKKK